MYHIYHIPKRCEWGCTINIERRLKDLGYKFSDLDRVIICGDINKAADMERDLNIEYGYGWNESRDYRIIMKAAENGGWNTETASKAGKKAGQLAVLSGQIHTFRKLGSIAAAKIIRECPHCGKIGKGNAMFQHHFDKCKLKK